MNHTLNVTEMSDEQLFAEYVDNKSQDAFTALHKRHSARVTKWIAHEFYFAFKGQAQDIVQQAFFKVHTEAAKFDRSKPFLPWLCRIAKNEAINEGNKIRRIKRGGDVKIVPIVQQHEGDYVEQSDNGYGDMEPLCKPTALSYFEATSDGDLVQHEATHEEIHSLIGTLSHEDQALYNAIYADDMTERDAAAKLGITRHRLRTQLADMHRRLKGTLTI